MAEKRPKVVYDGKFIRMVSRGGWEYASRKNLSGIVGIVGVTDLGEMLLIEQFRPPINKIVIEIPAGLAGDIKGSENEAARPRRLAASCWRNRLHRPPNAARRIRCSLCRHLR